MIRSRTGITGVAPVFDGLLSVALHFGGQELVESIQVGQSDPVVRHQAQGQLVIVFGFAPLAFDVQQSAKIAINGDVLRV